MNNKMLAMAMEMLEGAKLYEIDNIDIDVSGDIDETNQFTISVQLNGKRIKTETCCADTSIML